jgi:hypothetical protein
MATAANTVVGVKVGSRLHGLADRLVKARAEVSRVERALNNAVFELGQFGEDQRLQLKPEVAFELSRRQDKVKALRKEHEAACLNRDRAQKEYEKLPVVAETIEGVKKFHAEADAAVKEGSDLNNILKAQGTLKELGEKYADYVAGRDTAHAREGLLNVQESLGARAGSWMRTYEYEERCRKLLGAIL